MRRVSRAGAGLSGVVLLVGATAACGSSSSGGPTGWGGGVAGGGSGSSSGSGSGSGSGSVADIVPGCLDAMWAEGPGGGHYEIMSSTQYTTVSCGFAVAADGSVWGTQDYQ